MQFNVLTHFAKFNRLTLTVSTCGLMAGVTALAGCQAKNNEPNTPSSASAPVSTGTASKVNTDTAGDKMVIYTSTNVWGAIAKAVGGDNVEVVAAVNDPTQDPHDYQASANDKLAISKAKMVLVNGGGYDDWTTSLAESVANKPLIINAVTLSGLQPAKMAEHAHDEHEHSEHEHEAEAHDHDHKAEAHEHEAHDEHDHHHHHHGDFNEHVFFSLDTAKKVADAVANQLAVSDPNNKARYMQNATNFKQEIDTLKANAQAAGQGKQLTAFATEPVTGYLLAEMGIKDITPKGYVAQSETDAGVSVKVLNDSKTLLAGKKATIMIVNAQTEDATAKQLMAIATSAGVPTVAVNETLPTGVTTYQEFIKKTIDNIASAVQSAPKP